MDGDECKEEYRNCEYYTGGDKTICESIILKNSPLTKCSLTDKGCEEVSKSCSDISLEEPDFYCTNIKPKNNKKYCAYTNRGCEEHYTECENYEGNDKNECESIIVKNNIITNPHITKCVFENGKCKSQQKICSDYKSGQNSDFCENIELTDNDKHCVYINNECKEKYKECELYKGGIKSECESNIPKYDVFTKKCVFNEKDNTCLTQSKICSDYDIDSCGQYQLADRTKKCAWINNQCVTRYVECSYYKGTNQEECETIIPMTDPYETKCVYVEGICKSEKKTSCSDYKQGQEFSHCFNIPLSNEKKYCTLNEKNECVEQYKECSDYKGNDKTICESNISYDLRKCSYDNGSCNVLKEGCSFYKNFLERDECEKNNEFLNYKKCIFSDYQCIEKYKQCLDITNSATKEICENAPTSSGDKKCILNQNKCIEIDKDSEQNKEEESSQDEKKEEEGESKGKDDGIESGGKESKAEESKKEGESKAEESKAEGENKAEEKEVEQSQKINNDGEENKNSDRKEKAEEGNKNGKGEILKYEILFKLLFFIMLI